MRFTVDYPLHTVGYDPALVGAPGMTRVARTVEELGFDALAFSEHPAPPHKWVETGGHESLDQTSALAFCAAVTTRVRLMTYLLVLPYHHPLLAAKALSTVDLLSDGRVTVVAGTGYLRSEFLALNTDLERRNELFDEGLELMRAAWSGAPFSHEGGHFSARNTASLPLPAQAGGPPVLIGGNSARARARAALNQGWSPLLVSPEAAKASRTAGIGTIEELAARIAEVREKAAAHHGDGSALTIQAHTPQTGFLLRGGSVEEHRDHLGRLTDAGVDAFVVRPPGDTVQRTVDALHTYAEAFLP
ncbi:putative F420-dependent oxidoreductase [Actinocorallia herbida]|uniref:Putative F420-dependent oxidoreductase n=1 Tax=Actinocorallia herbida TaxID=58109 RepID=A0A3N1D1S6_9ACTN|nr:TIGR03619 family F420-dependent LLM class oxidoreductase [Actinocorallia herbida]ROO87456.1 putative F420-dependent oxidoreductase [Actinocorallia herbida]